MIRIKRKRLCNHFTNTHTHTFFHFQYYWYRHQHQSKALKIAIDTCSTKRPCTHGAIENVPCKFLLVFMWPLPTIMQQTNMAATVQDIPLFLHAYMTLHVASHLKFSLHCLESWPKFSLQWSILFTFNAKPSGDVSIFMHRTKTLRPPPHPFQTDMHVTSLSFITILHPP